MKYILSVIIILFVTVSKAQTGLKPCKIFYMNQRQYAYVYRDNDSLKKELVAFITKDNRAEFPKKMIQMYNGFYQDSAGARYYYKPDRSLWQNVDGKILKTVP